MVFWAYSHGHAPLVINELPMGNPWSVHGLYMDNPLIIHGLSMGDQWLSCLPEALLNLKGVFPGSQNPGNMLTIITAMSFFVFAVLAGVARQVVGGLPSNSPNKFPTRMFRSMLVWLAGWLAGR